jgi:hypothetical protein
MMMANPFNRWAMGWENGGTENHPIAHGVLLSATMMSSRWWVAHRDTESSGVMVLSRVSLPETICRLDGCRLKRIGGVHLFQGTDLSMVCCRVVWKSGAAFSPIDGHDGDPECEYQ